MCQRGGGEGVGEGGVRGEEGGISGLIQQPPAEMGPSLGGETRVLSPIGTIPPTHLLSKARPCSEMSGKTRSKGIPGLRSMPLRKRRAFSLRT